MEWQATDADLSANGKRTIEVTETKEVPIVSRQPHLEEVVVSKMTTVTVRDAGLWLIMRDHWRPLLSWPGQVFAQRSSCRNIERSVVISGVILWHCGIWQKFRSHKNDEVSGILLETSFFVCAPRPSP